MSKTKNIRWLFCDVDGTMTDGGIYYDDAGHEFKKFNIKDGAGILMAQRNGIEIAVLTGRECSATERRMAELGVRCLFQNVKDKAPFLKSFLLERNIAVKTVAYIGDDLNDLDCMQLVKDGGGLCACPADAVNEVKAACDCVCTKNGGFGAVRECIEWLLARSEG